MNPHNNITRRERGRCSCESCRAYRANQRPRRGVNANRSAGTVQRPAGWGTAPWSALEYAEEWFE